MRFSLNAVWKQKEGGTWRWGSTLKFSQVYSSRPFQKKPRSTAVKMRELYRSSRRDVLKYYRKRTICKCLKRMHLEARKACPKMGTCNGCLEEKERALLMVCSRCGVGQYCSRACQVSDWSNHRRYCDLNEHWQHANKR